MKIRMIAPIRNFSTDTEEIVLTKNLKIINGSLLNTKIQVSKKTRCLATPSRVVAVFRTDIKDILIEKLSNHIGSETFLYVNKGDLVFDFHKLVVLFKDELISNQVLYSSEDEKPVIFYTPTQVKVIGYA